MRYEFKYFVPNFQLPELRAMLLPFVEPDSFARKNPGWQYTVRSIYFETADFEMYQTKIDHLAHRMKVRLRGYNVGNDDSQVFLEIKRKYEGPIRKARATLPYGAVKKLFAGAVLEDILPATRKGENVRRFFYQIHSRQLRPLVNVVYEREAYLSKTHDPENDFRLTIDKNLRSVPFPKVDELYLERDLGFPLDNQFILEVKFNKYCPAWAKPILASLNLQKGPASKYVLCVDCQPVIKPDRRGQHFFRGG